ncbi:MAG TPA: hypothetical protein VK934_12145 [Fimbriimonas sp.]|nr:hypothetical protein [Fimbriimonas sp.]
MRAVTIMLPDEVAARYEEANADQRARMALAIERAVLGAAGNTPTWQELSQRISEWQSAHGVDTSDEAADAFFKELCAED